MHILEWTDYKTLVLLWDCWKFAIICHRFLLCPVHAASKLMGATLSTLLHYTQQLKINKDENTIMFLEVFFTKNSMLFSVFPSGILFSTYLPNSLTAIYHTDSSNDIKHEMGRKKYQTIIFFSHLKQNTKFDEKLFFWGKSFFFSEWSCR